MSEDRIIPESLFPLDAPMTAANELLTGLGNAHEHHVHVNPVTGFSPELGRMHPAFAEPLINELNNAVVIAHGYAEEAGWHKSFPKEHDYRTLAIFEKAKLDWIGNKLLLVASELVEAQEELRNGKAPLEHYYRDVDNHCGAGTDFTTSSQSYGDLEGKNHPESELMRHIESRKNDIPLLKPEGFVTESADAAIRLLDLLGMLMVEDFGEKVVEKLEYNATRGQMHGGKQF